MTTSGSELSEAQEPCGSDGTRESSTDLAQVPEPIRDIVQRLAKQQQTESASEDTTTSPNSLSQSFEQHKAEQRKQRAWAIYEAANVPARHKQLKTAEIKHKEWLEAAEKIKAMLGNGCIAAIVGSRGTGKTQLGVQAIRDAAILGADSLYIKAIDIFINMRECYRTEEVSESKLIKAFTKYRLLVIDALEEKSDSEWENRMLSHIIDKRYDEMVDTVLISNEQPAAFLKQHGSSIADRIRETGGIIECNWTSFRSS